MPSRSRRSRGSSTTARCVWPTRTDGSENSSGHDTVDPTSRLFTTYADYLAWCRECGTAPDDAESAIIRDLEPDDFEFLPFYYDLVTDVRSSEISVIWDVVMFDETPLLVSTAEHRSATARRLG